MKWIYLNVLLACSLIGSVFAYEVPTDAQIQKVLSDPSSIIGLIDGANCSEAAATIAAVLGKLDGQNLTDQQKSNFLALLVAKATKAYPDRIELAYDLVELVNDDWDEIVVAAAYTATGLDEDFKKALASKAPGAVEDPEGVLGTSLYRLILGGGVLIPIQSLNLPLPAPPLMAGVANSVPGGDRELAAKIRLVRATFPTATLPTIKLLCQLSRDDLNRYLNRSKGTRNLALDALRDGDLGKAIEIIRGGGAPPAGDSYQS